MLVPIPWVHMGFGALLVFLSIPLMLRKIPMNCAYGIRTRKSLASQYNWYELNAYGGKLLLAYGLFLAAFGWLSQGVSPPPTSLWAPVFLAVPLFGLIPVFALVGAHGKRLPD